MENQASSAHPHKGKERVAVTVRVPEALLRQIDRHIEAREVPISRNNWLLEAVVEKLARQEQSRRRSRNGA